MPVIEYLYAGSPEPTAHLLGAFRKGLSESGYVEGRNVAIEFRWAHNGLDRLPELAVDLVRRRVSVIVAPGRILAAVVAKSATTTIPIVFMVGSDPVKLGLVASFNRPGGNATGINFFVAELVEKRLGLLHELVPSARRVAVLVNPANAATTEATMRDVETAARAMALQIQDIRQHQVEDDDVHRLSPVQGEAACPVFGMNDVKARLAEILA
jgi:putative tryptophan/tyrosine transport system substrate-binding protein